MNVVVLDGEKVVAANGELEACERHGIGNESLAMAKIECDAVHGEPWKFMKAQMRNGCENVVNRSQMRLNGVVGGNSSANVVVKFGKEVVINFATAKNIAGFTRHAAAAILAHPLQVVRVVSASFKASCIPRPKALALCAEHLITSVGFVNGNLAIRAWLGVVLQSGDGSDSVRIAHMKRIVVRGLEFAAVRTGVLVTCGTLPIGRHEAIAFGISTAMNELRFMVMVWVVCVVMSLS